MVMVAKFLAKNFPDIPRGVEGIIGGPPNNYAASPKLTWSMLMHIDGLITNQYSINI